jgi:hypothetical protein
LTAFQAYTFNLESADISGPGQGVLVADFDRDGRYDLLRWVGSATDAAPNRLYLSNGDGSFRSSSLGTLGTETLKKTDGSADVLLGDFTGRGYTELLVVKASGGNQLYTRSDYTPPDLLKAVTTSLGQATSLSYQPLSNSTRYVSGRTDGAAILPKVDISPPLQVVVTMETTGGGSTLTRQYSYKGLRASMNGRGLLGFTQVREQTKAPDGRDITHVTDYWQDMPYIGLPSQQRTYSGALDQAGALLARTTYSYCDSVSGATGGSIDTSSPQPPTPCTVADTQVVKRPYAYQTLKESWDLNGKSLSSTLTTSAFGSFGDELSRTVTTSGPAVGGGTENFVETTTTEYCPPRTDGMSTSPTCPSGQANPHRIDGNYWVIGRPTKVSVERTVPDSLPATGAGTAPNATAVAGNSAPPPLNPAVLNAILSLLLDD